MATRPIDEKIVAMKLDNSDFKQKANETTGIFGKLRNSLDKIPGVNLGKTTKELGDISDKAKSTNLDKLTSSVQNVASKFTALGVIATTTLVNLTNRAVNAGLQLGKSLTLDPIIDGFQEYETKIGSIKTILSNTQWAGTSLKDVNGALSDLNTYADKTIYNFGEMTSSIGRFTAAGVKLDDSTIAIKGLSNLAAASGSNVEQLNSAMYQMSQAMAAGRITLMDWNSLVNAGMGGKKTQDALLATAKAMGKNVDMSDGFRNSLQKGWLTSDVFLKTMQKFGKDKSMIEAATKVRTFSQLMDTVKESIGSGWATTFEQIFGDFNESTKLWSGLADSVTGWVSRTSKARNEFVKGVADGGGMANIFKGIQNAAKPVIQIFQALGTGFKKAFPPATISQVINMTKRFKDFTSGLSLSSSTVGKLSTVFQGAFSIFDTAWEIIKRLGKAFLQLIPKGTGGSILDIMVKIAKMAIAFNQSVKDGNALTSAIESLGKAFSVVGKILSGVTKFIGDVGSYLIDHLGGAIKFISNLLAPFGQAIKDAFGGVGPSEVVGAGLIVGILALIKKIEKAIDAIKGLFKGTSGLVDKIKETLGGVGEALHNFTLSVKITNLVLIAGAIGILAISLKTLEGINAANISKGITALAISLGVMIGGMMLIDKFNVTGGFRAATTLIALAAAVNIMAEALKKISDLNPEELNRGISGLASTVAILTAAIIVMGRLGGKISTSSIQLISLSTAIYIIAGAVDKMAKINTGSLFQSIGALALIFGELAIFLKVVDRTKLSVASAVGLIAVGAALKIMVSAIQDISGINIPGIITGLITIAALLAEIVIFSKLASGPSMIAAGVGLTLIGVALNLMIPPIQTLGSMSLAELAKGLGGIAVALTAVTLASIFASGGIVGAVAITVIAAALNLLLIPIEAFAHMSWQQLLMALTGLALSLTVVSVAALLLSPAVVPMLAFGAALLVMGAAMALAGVGVAAFAAGLGALATITIGAVASIIATLRALIKGLGTLIPGAVKFIVDLGIALLDGLTRLIPKLMSTMGTLIMSLLNTIAKYLPSFIEKGAQIIIELIQGFGNEAPKILDAAVKTMIKMIDGMAKAIRDNGPKLVASVLNLVGEVLILIVQAGVQVVNALLGWWPGVSAMTTKLGKGAENAIRSSFGAASAGRDKGKDFANGLGGKSGDAHSAGSKVGKAGKDGTDSSNYRSTGSGNGSDFVNALAGKAGSARSAGKGIANAGKSGAGSISMHSTGSNFGEGFAGGIGSAIDHVVSAAKRLAKSAANTVKGWLGIRSPSRLMRIQGGFFGEGFGLGITDQIRNVSDKAKSLAKTAKDSVNSFLENFDPTPDNNDIHFKAVVDYDGTDMNNLSGTANIKVNPDASLTSDLVASTDPKSNIMPAPQVTVNTDTKSLVDTLKQQLAVAKEQIRVLTDIKEKDPIVPIGDIMTAQAKETRRKVAF